MDTSIYDRFIRRPSALGEEIHNSFVVIDEILTIKLKNVKPFQKVKFIYSMLELPIDQIALEIKGSEVFQDKMLTGLKAPPEEKKIKRYFLIFRDPVARKIEGIQVMYYQDFLNQLWDDQIVVDYDP